MINKIYKIVNNTDSRVLKFIFFIRYLIALFLLSGLLFILVPKYLDNEKKIIIIKQFLIQNYNLELKTYSKINYNIFPTPNISIKNFSANIKEFNSNIDSGELKIFLALKNIYNFNNLKIKKISIDKTKINVPINEVENFLKYFLLLENKLKLNSTSLFLKYNEEIIINLKKINFSNYYPSVLDLNGLIFDNEFQVKYLKDISPQKLKIKVNKLGIKSDITILKNINSENIEGLAKIKILKNKLKFNYKLSKQLKIYNSDFRNKNLLTTFDGVINFIPFFDANLDINIKSIKNNFFKDINYGYFLDKKNLIKKLNGQFNVFLKRKELKNKLVLNSQNGDFKFKSEINLNSGFLVISGDLLPFDTYPRLNFILDFDAYDKNSFKKKLLFSNKSKINYKKIHVTGFINLMSNKIIFNEIVVNGNEKYNIEDRKLYKQYFEEIILKDDLLNIFKFKKYEKFFKEIN